MVNDVNEIKLSIHDCYTPVINIFWWNEYKDINYKVYYKALFTDSEGVKRGFIVRNDFVEKWKLFLIAEITIKKTAKGATLIGYETFDEIQEKRSIEFIEVKGVFVTGVYQIQFGEAENRQMVYFIPSFPSRFSFNSHRRLYYDDDSKLFKSFYIKVFSSISLSLICNTVFYCTEEEYDEGTQSFIILNRSRCEYEYTEVNEFGSKISGDYYITKSIVYKVDNEYNYRSNTFEFGGWGKFELPDEMHEPIKKFILERQSKLFKDYDFIEAVKKVVKTIINQPLKIEYRSSRPYFIEELGLKKHLYSLKGTPYIGANLCLGLEQRLEYSEDIDEAPLNDEEFEMVSVSVDVVIHI